MPRHTDVILLGFRLIFNYLLGDNIDVARPGDEVEITGIYTHR